MKWNWHGGWWGGGDGDGGGGGGRDCRLIRIVSPHPWGDLQGWYKYTHICLWTHARENAADTCHACCPRTEAKDRETSREGATSPEDTRGPFHGHLCNSKLYTCGLTRWLKGKGACDQTRRLEFDPQDPRGWRKEPAPGSYPPPSHHGTYVGMHTCINKWM